MLYLILPSPVISIHLQGHFMVSLSVSRKYSIYNVQGTESVTMVGDSSHICKKLVILLCEDCCMMLSATC